MNFVILNKFVILSEAKDLLLQYARNRSRTISQRLTTIDQRPSP